MAEDDEPPEVTEFTFDYENNTYTVKRADSFLRMGCGDDNCDLIHIISLDRQGVPIVETTFTPEQLLKLLGFEPDEDEEEEDAIGEVKGNA